MRKASEVTVSELVGKGSIRDGWSVARIQVSVTGALGSPAGERVCPLLHRWRAAPTTPRCGSLKAGVM